MPETTKFTKNNYCRLCKSKNLSNLIDFGDVALGNNLQDTFKEAINVEEYPLQVLNCNKCNHFQLSCAVNPNLLYATNYTYLSGVGLSFVKHIKSYVEWVKHRTKLTDSSLVVEIGSNDGTCLEIFKNNGYKVCGVDPAELAAKIAMEKNVFTINEFFNVNTSKTIINKFGQPDLITSQNVLAHVNDLGETFTNIYKLLKDKGYFVFEIGYFRNVLESGCFDTIYHEHLDYHHAAPLVKYLSSIGFDVVDLEVNNIQGGSLRLLLKKTGEGRVSLQAQDFLVNEKRSVLNNKNFLLNWSEKVVKICNNLEAVVKELLVNNVNCYAYGSPTKATLLLKMSKFLQDNIRFIVEDNKNKVGKFLPKSSLPIYDVNELDFNTPAVIIILAWNFADDIIIKLKKLYKVKVTVIIPLPELRVINI